MAGGKNTSQKLAKKGGGGLAKSGYAGVGGESICASPSLPKKSLGKINRL